VLPILPIVIGAAASEHRFGPAALAAGLAVCFVAIGLFAATVNLVESAASRQPQGENGARPTSSSSDEVIALRLLQVCRYCVSDGVPRRSLFVAMIVGTVLNLINQGDFLLADGKLNLTKIVLTYAVPYCVATYGAASYRLKVARTTGRD
jgi:hypothetical protein